MPLPFTEVLLPVQVAVPVEEEEGRGQSAVVAVITAMVTITGKSKSNSFLRTEGCFSFALLVFVNLLMRRPFLLLCV